MLKKYLFSLLMFISSTEVFAYVSVPSTDSDGNFTLTLLQSASPFTMLEVERRRGSGSWGVIGTWRGGSSVSQSLATGTYSYRARGFFTTYGNTKVYNNYGAIDTITVQSAPAAPSGLKINDGNVSQDGVYTVSWNSRSTATYYRWREKINSGGWSNLTNTSSISFNRNKNNGTYTYNVQACNSVGCSSFSSVAVTVIKNSAPSLSASESTSTDSSFNLNWTTGAYKGVNSSANLFYRLQERVDYGSWSNVMTSSGVLQRSVTGKSNGFYQYRVSACESVAQSTYGHTYYIPGSCGSYSNIRSVTVDIPPPPTPSLSVPSSSTTGEFNVSLGGLVIGNSSSGNRVILERRKNGGSWSSVASTVNGETVMQIVPGGTYSYRAVEMRPQSTYGHTYYIPASGYSSVRTITVNTPDVQPDPDIVYSRSKVSQFSEQAKLSGDPLAELVGLDIQELLNSYGISLTEDKLIWDRDLDTVNFGRGCNKGSLSRLHASVEVDTEDSEFKFNIDALKKPIMAMVNLSGSVDVNGKLKAKAGFRVFGSCVSLVKTRANLELDADFAFSLGLILNLNPELVEGDSGDLVIRIDPKVQLFGNVSKLSNVDLDVNVDWDILDIFSPATIFGNTLVNLGSVLLEVGEATGVVPNDFTEAANTTYQAALAQQQEMIQQKVSKLPRRYVVPYGQYGGDVVDGLLSFIEYYPQRFPVSYQYIKDNEEDILYSLLVGDQDNLEQILGTSVACQAASGLQTSMRTTARPSGFISTNYTSYCDEVINSGSGLLGSASAWDNDGAISETPWTLNPSNAIDLGIVSIKDNYQPYMKKARYKTIQNTWDFQICNIGGCVDISVPTGDCDLEMRVYKKDTRQTNLKPLMAIHGGSWRYRGGAFVGMDTQISHYTEQGFVVFVPFYRLVGDSDGSSQCNNASGEDIIADIQSALDWVESNKSRFGATGKISLMGQSAGAHLSGWLATHRASQIDKALLYYGPTDFKDLVTQYNNGADFSPQGVTALAGFLGVETDQLNTVNPNAPFVLQNSFPDIITQNPSAYPKMYLVHGVADELVPSEQSVRMCNALYGNISGGPASNYGGNPNSGTYKSVYQCNSGSQLDLIAEARHILEICLVPENDTLCRTGSSGSVQAARQTITNTLNWIK